MPKSESHTILASRCCSEAVGRVPKWTKGTDCKSVIRGFESHLGLSTTMWPGAAGGGSAVSRELASMPDYPSITKFFNLFQAGGVVKRGKTAPEQVPRARQTLKNAVDRGGRFLHLFDFASIFVNQIGCTAALFSADVRLGANLGGILTTDEGNGSFRPVPLGPIHPASAEAAVRVVHQHGL